MTPRESRVVVVTALRWARAHERQSTRMLRRRERELLKVCALAAGDEKPSVASQLWQCLCNLVGGGRAPAVREGRP